MKGLYIEGEPSSKGEKVVGKFKKLKSKDGTRLRTKRWIQGLISEQEDNKLGATWAPCFPKRISILVP